MHDSLKNFFSSSRQGSIMIFSVENDHLQDRLKAAAKGRDFHQMNP